MAQNEKLQVVIEPFCDEPSVEEAKFENPVDIHIRQGKTLNKYNLAQFVFNREKYHEIAQYRNNRIAPTTADCFVNALDIGNLITLQEAALMRLMLKNCNVGKQEKDIEGTNFSIIEEILTYLSMYHREQIQYYYRIMNYRIENLAFLEVLLNKLQIGNFCFITYSYIVDNKEKSHIVLVTREETGLFIYDQQVNPLVQPLTQEYFQDKYSFGFIAKSPVGDGRRKLHFYGNIYGVDRQYNQFIDQTINYKEVKFNEAKLIIHDNLTSNQQLQQQLKPYDATLAKMVEMHKDCFEASTEGYSQPEEYMKKLLSSEKERVCIAYDPQSNNILGFCFISKNPYQNNQTYFYIHDVCIEKNNRRKNVCTALMRYVTQFYQSADYLMLEVLKSNGAAQRCYSKLDFEVTEEFGQQKEDLVKSQIITTVMLRMARKTRKCPDTQFHEYIQTPKRYFLTPGGEYYKYDF